MKFTPEQKAQVAIARYALESGNKECNSVEVEDVRHRLLQCTT